MTPIEIAGLALATIFLFLWIATHSTAKKARAVAVADAAALKNQAVEDRTLLEKKIHELEFDLQGIKTKFASILSIEDEVNRLTKEANETEFRTKQAQLSYAEKRKYLEQLEGQIAIFDSRLAFAELGVYEPHFEFSDTEEFKDAIKKVREEQKALISGKEATRCTTEWTVEGSRLWTH